MPSGTQQERHVAHVAVRMVLEHVARECGDDAMSRVLTLAGERRPLAVMVEDAEWSSYGQFRRLLDAAGEVLGGHERLARMATADLTGGSMPSSTEMLQLLGSPSALFAEVAQGHNGMMTFLEQGGEQTGPTEWVMRNRMKPGFEPFPEFCSLSLGLNPMTPRLFGYDDVVVTEETCENRGDEWCSYRIRWEENDEATRQRLALEQRVTLLERRMEMFQETVADLVLADDLGTALDRVVRAASRAVRAQGFIVSIEPSPGQSRRVYSNGLAHLEAERIVALLVAGEPCDAVGDVVEIASSRRHYGLLIAYDPDGIMLDDTAVMQAYARLAATALDSATAMEETRREAARARALLTLAGALTDIADTDTMAMSLARATLDVIGADRAFVTFADWDANVARIVACHGFDAAFEAEATGAAMPLADPLPEVIQYIDSAGAAQYSDRLSRGTGALAHVVVPITVSGKVEGWLTASVTSDPQRLAPNAELEARLNGLAAQASTALRNTRLVEQIRHQALHDALTDLPNRALILDRAEQMLARAERNRTPVAALFVDLDGFKEVNDTLGHAAGDQLLRAVANRLATTIRGSDTLARLGGDEFVVLVDSASFDTGPRLVAERLLDVLADPFVLEGREDTPLTVTASIGIATATPGSTAGDLLRNADVALYNAKAAGKNCSIMFAPEMQTALRDRVDLEHDLRGALAADQFFLVYQPTFDLHTGEVGGVEALLRWRHPTRGVLLPDAFLPILEDTGLISPVGRWVLAAACAQTAAWHAAGHPIEVSVNVSARQLDTDRLLDDVRDALATSGLDAGSLILEITETAIMRDTDASVRRLTALKALGVRLAIDDFGTGYSSLAYLRQFPVDTLKIDGSFIRSIADSPDARTLIHTLVHLGKSLGLTTLAEGIEDTAQLDHLRVEDCDAGQGFLFARPLSPTDLLAFLANAANRAEVPARRPALEATSPL
jgi:diguanylate cyclase (GGDEF)-like protein